jgi:hypothetical protein
MKRLFLLLLYAKILVEVNAGEGMWNLLLLDSLNYKDMQEKGLRLSPEEIYSINKACLKDAVVIFGGGCTGELISPDGLLITNHHCGYSRIQSHSTVEKNYLANGFWAGSKSEELANPGLSVTILVRIEDVTAKVLANVPDSITEEERNTRVTTRLSELQKEAVAGTHYDAEIKSFYYGREYYLFVYEIFNDVRLVGAPPEAIGRFGGDTDNWVWPRHTGDFSLFRIYADKDNKPAPYSPDNIPYKPRKHLNISAAGIKEGDFTMVLGYPGRTDEYLTSDALRMISQKSLPAKIEMRTLRLDALEDEMAKGPRERLRYSGRYVGASNAWKKWIGVTKGIERSDALKKKEILEGNFDSWAKKLTCDKAGYSTLLDELRELYKQLEPLYITNDLGNELLNSIEVFNLVSNAQSEFYSMLDSSAQYRKTTLQKMQETGKGFLKSGSGAIDRLILPSLLRIYAENTAPKYHPDFYGQIRTEFGGNYAAYVDDAFNRSVFSDSTHYVKLLNKSLENIRKQIVNDPLVIIYRDFTRTLMFDVYRKSDSLNRALNRLYRKYLTGLMIMDTSRIFYPDANFTMRLAYGKVEGYKPSDAVYYGYCTTLDGILEKEDPEISDYQVPGRLKEVFVNHDFGSYATNNKVPVCFIASNHTSGGNSGSPVLNAEGNLIGINFDRNWEGTVSDYAYDPSICRNISLDIRYVLFIIDIVADADWILDELTILKN